MIHHVFANRSNAGDWLSALAIQDLLGPATLAEHLCDGPFQEQSLLRLERAPADTPIIVGGGGLFHDYFAPFWRGLLRILGDRTLVIWGVGVCDLVGSDSLRERTLFREAALRARLCSVRDERTREVLGIAGLPEPIPCPSLCQLEPIAEPGSGILHVAHFELAGAEFYAGMVARLRESAAAGQRKYFETNHRFRDGWRNDLDDVLRLYRRADLVVSSRLHGCIFAVGLGRAVLAVGGDWKIWSFMRAAGLGDWVVDVGDLEVLDARLADLPGQPAPRAFVEDAKRRQQAFAVQVRNVLGLPG